MCRFCETSKHFGTDPICFIISHQIDQLKIKQSMKAMTEMFYASLFGYDEVCPLHSVSTLTKFVFGNESKQEGNVNGKP